jgi:hypothetical protein
MVFLITFVTFLLSKAGQFWTCLIDGVKDIVLICAYGGSLSTVQPQLFFLKITNEFVGKLDIFCVQFVGHVFFLYMCLITFIFLINFQEKM